MIFGWLAVALVMFGLVAFAAFYRTKDELSMSHLLTSESIFLLLALESIPTVWVLSSILEAYLLAQTGAILLDRDKTVESSYFGRTRVFHYEQIFEVGVRTERTGKRKYLRYYAYDEVGGIDPNRIREAHLINVQSNEEVLGELQRRMAGPPPTEEALRAFRNRFTVNPFPLILVGGSLWMLGYFVIVPLLSGAIKDALRIALFLALTAGAAGIGLLRWKKHWRDE